MVDQMKTVLESVKANLTTTQTQMKEYADRLRWSEMFHKGTEALYPPKTYGLIYISHQSYEGSGLGYTK